MFLSLDGTAWIQLINFALFFALLNVVFLRPVGEAIKKRRAYIDGVQSDYDRYAHQVSSYRSDADQKRAAARRDAEETVARARAAAETDAAAEVVAQTARAQIVIDRARETVATEVAAAGAREDELSHTLARALLERAVGTSR